MSLPAEEIKKGVIVLKATIKISSSAKFTSIEDLYRFYTVELNSVVFGSSSSIETILTEETFNSFAPNCRFYAVAFRRRLLKSQGQARFRYKNG